jgi:hypothetical protein
MSKQIWNSVGERTTCNRLIAKSYQMYLDESSSNSSSSSSSSSSGSFNSYTSSSSSESSMSDDSIDLLDDVQIPTTIEYARRIYTPLEDTTIPFNSYNKIIADYNDYQCLHNFRFRKDDLQLFANEMWNGIKNILNGTKDKIVCEGTGCVVHYETGLCVMLYRFANVCRFRSDMEAFFALRKTKLNSIMVTFATILPSLLTVFLCMHNSSTTN